MSNSLWIARLCFLLLAFVCLVNQYTIYRQRKLIKTYESQMDEDSKKFSDDTQKFSEYAQVMKDATEDLKSCHQQLLGR